MKLTSHAGRRLAATAACAAVLWPTAAFAAASPAATAGSPAWGRRAHHVTVYVADGDGSTVTPIRAGTNRAGKAIPVGSFPEVITITPDGRRPMSAAATAW